MDIPTTLVLLLVGGAILGWVTSPRTGQGLEAFGLGFIGYRSYGWPKGVQEEDTVHFSFTQPPSADTSADLRPFDPDAGPELIELDHAEAETTRLR